MLPSEITFEKVRDAIASTQTWQFRTIDTDDVVMLVLGWNGSRKSLTRPPVALPAGCNRGVRDLTKVSAKHPLLVHGARSANAREQHAKVVRRYLTMLVEQGPVWRSPRGRGGYEYRWITDEDLSARKIKQAVNERVRALALRISKHVSDPENLDKLGEYEAVNYHVANLDTEHGLKPDLQGTIRVRLSEAQAEQYAIWLEKSAQAVVEAKRCNGTYDDGIADGNLSGCCYTGGCGLTDCPYNWNANTKAEGQ
jgi:hypothetical protein